MDLVEHPFAAGFRPAAGHVMIGAMFARLFRLADRLGRLTAQLSIRAGDLLIDSLGYLIRGARRQAAVPGLESESGRTEAQVQSLTGLTVLLLAAVLTLVLWATSSQREGNPGVRLFSLGGSAAEEEGAQAPDLAPTPIAQVPSLGSTGTIVFSMLAGTQEDLFALAAGQTAPTRLTDSPADDRSPAWSPGGQQLAFASRRDGNWELYILEMATGEIRRLTYDLAYEGAPTWSPDGQWIAYEAYYDGNLDIYLIKADATEGPYRVTHNPAPDFSPRWTTAVSGREIVYVSWREGNQDLFLISLDDPNEARAINLTRTPRLNEGSPAWSPDANLIAYSAVEEGIPLVYTRQVASPEAAPTVVGQGAMPAWSPDGSGLVFVARRAGAGGPSGSLLLTGQFGTWESSVEAFALPASASDPDWTAGALPAAPQGSLAFAFTAPLPGPPAEPMLPLEDPNGNYRLINLGGVIAESPWLSDRVDASFMALRDHVNQAAGWDFLGRLDNVWWAIDRPLEPGQDYRSWHKAGRAFDIVQAYNQGSPAQVEVVPEQQGSAWYWRLYIRAAVQDGTLGEPLRELPWDFSARTSGDVDAYEAGGRLRDTVPAGYYVDFTQLAERYGWFRTPADASWRYNWPGVLYWQYEKRDGLDWWAAMLELYPPTTLEQSFYTPTPAPTAVRLSPSPTTGSTAEPEGGTAAPTATPTATATPARGSD